MSVIRNATFEEFASLLGRAPNAPSAEQISKLVTKTLGRGDGVAVYQNEDLGHYNLGCVTLGTYGSPAAQFETEEPPTQWPDGLPTPDGGTIGWRYQLVMTYKGNEAAHD